MIVVPQDLDGRSLPERAPSYVECAICHRVLASRATKGERRPVWHKDHRGRPCGGRVLAGKPCPVPTRPARVLVPASAWVAALALLHDVAALAGDRTLPCLCGAPPGCSHASDCVIPRAEAVAAALAGEERAAT